MTKAGDGKRYKLTPKQEQFAQLVAEGQQSLSDCYRAAYDTSRMNDKQINEEASKLGNHPKITQRVAEIKAPVIAKSQLNFADIITGLQKAAELADQTAQAGAMVSAYRELGKLIDAYPAERKEITMTDDIVERLQRGRSKRRKSSTSTNIGRKVNDARIRIRQSDAKEQAQGKGKGQEEAKLHQRRSSNVDYLYLIMTSRKLTDIPDTLLEQALGPGVTLDRHGRPRGR